MKKIILKEIITEAFDILENNGYISYTKKYSKEYLIEGFSQEGKVHWKWFDFSATNGISKQLNRMIDNNMNKPKRKSWFTHFIFISGYKWCESCEQAKLPTDFYVEKRAAYNLSSYCKDCINKKHKEYANNNPEKIKETRKNTYEKKKLEDPGYFKRKNSLARSRFKERTPLWVSEEEIWMIQCFYVDCPEGYHVDHIIPLNGELVSGLHILSNLQYLSSSDNLSKGNNFLII